MLSQDQAEALANHHLQAYTAGVRCEDLGQVKLALQKMVACTCFAYVSVSSHADVIELLTILTKRFSETVIDVEPAKIITKDNLNG